MDLKEIRRRAREKFKGACRVCPVCNGVACAGEVPGMGGLGTGESFQNNIAALRRYRVNMRVVHGVERPSAAVSLWGLELALPVIGAPIGGMAFNMNGAVAEDAYCRDVIAGCRRAGVIGMTGDGGPKPSAADPAVFGLGLDAIRAQGGLGIPMIKPRPTDDIIAMADMAAKAGAVAFGIDIDAAALVNMKNAGQAVGPKSMAELRRIKENAAIPFIVKGIMTADEARLCCQAGVDAIVVSNHGGRALDCTPGTAEVLPDIADAVHRQMIVLVDGGVRTGVDVLKMIALGADAALVGRPISIGAVGGGEAGVAAVLMQMKAELEAAMLLTGTADLRQVSPEILC